MVGGGNTNRLGPSEEAKDIMLYANFLMLDNVGAGRNNYCNMEKYINRMLYRIWSSELFQPQYSPACTKDIVVRTCEQRLRTRQENGHLEDREGDGTILDIKMIVSEVSCTVLNLFS